MEGVRTFLEASSIHGLTYISTSRKFAKVFWIIIVVGGFTLAGYMINNSFKSWSERPIKTTLETRPISEITLPKVTVCPPKNTYTDLNYDLLLAENVTLTDELRADLFSYAKKLVDEHVYMNDLDKLQEDNRYYNWYHGYTKMISTAHDKDGVNYFISTSAPSGVVTTQYYEEKYHSKRVENKVYYQVNVFPSESIRNNPNVTLHFKLEKLSITGMAYGHDDINVDGNALDEGLTSTLFNFTPPAPLPAPHDVRSMRLFRNIPEYDIMISEMNRMPGFRLSWFYTGTGVGDIDKYKRFYDYDYNKGFRR